MTSKPALLAATVSALLMSASAMAASPSSLFDAKQMARVIQTVGSDAFEGRGPNTPGETKTVAYLTEQFRAAGLQPGGDLAGGKRSWTQAVPLLQSDLASPP